jgi:hypothetical protein
MFDGKPIVERDALLKQMIDKNKGPSFKFDAH